MHLSTAKEHPGFAKWRECMDLGKRISVSLDGQNVEHCTEASEEAGYVICHAIDGDGNLRTNNGYLEWEKREGKVVITIEEPRRYL